MNKPLDPALDAIGEQSAAQQVRRVLLYVVPDPGERTDRLADQLEAPPGLARVLLGSLSTLPRNESISEELSRVKTRNRRASLRDLDSWRRLDLLPRPELSPPSCGGGPFCARAWSRRSKRLRNLCAARLLFLRVPSALSDGWPSRLRHAAPER